MRDRSIDWLGIALLIAATSLFGVSPSLARLAFSGGTTPETVAMGRFVLGGLSIALFLAARPGRQERRMTLQDLGATALLALVNIVQSVSLLRAVTLIPVGVAHLIFYLFPLGIALLGWIFDRRFPGWLTFAALGLCFGGVALTTGGGGGVNGEGVGLAFLSAVSVAIFVHFGTASAQRLGSVSFGGMVMAWSGLMLGTAMLIFDAVVWPTQLLGWLAFLGTAIAFTLAMIFYFAAFTRIGTRHGAILTNLEPLFAILFALVILGEALAPLQLVGAAIVLVTIVLAAVIRRGMHKKPTGHSDS